MENISEGLKREFRNPEMRKRYRELFDEIIKDPEVATFLTENQDKLTKQGIVASFSKLYEFVNLKHQIANGKATFAPGYEPHLIVSDHHIEVVYEQTQEFVKQQKAEKRDRIAKMIQLPKSLQDASIEKYDIAGRAEPLKAALTFIDECIDYPQSNVFPKGLYLFGSLGVGKTYLLAAIANKLAENDIHSLLLHFPSFSVQMAGAIEKGNPSQILNEVKKIPVLMLDDIGSTRLTSWMRDDVLGIILEYRMQNELPTLFSSNLSMDELQKNYLTYNNRGDNEPLKAMRIMERIKFLATEYQMVGPNRRNPD